MLWIAIGTALLIGMFVVVLACCKVSGDCSRYEEREERPLVPLKVRRLG